MRPASDRPGKPAAPPPRPRRAYDAQHIPVLVLWMARGGLDEEQIAKELGIAKKTLLAWAGQYKEVAAALKEGKAEADARVEEGLYERARGLDVEETEVKQDQAGKRSVKRVRKHIPASVTAAMFWLRARQPEKWNKAADAELPPKLKVPDRPRPAKKAPAASEPAKGGGADNGADKAKPTPPAPPPS